jgi:hypothetical protein
MNMYNFLIIRMIMKNIFFNIKIKNGLPDVLKGN